MAYRVVIPPMFGRQESMIPTLEAGGCEIVRLPAPEAGQKFEWTPELVEAYIKDADALLGTFANMRVTREVLQAGKKLRIVTSPIIGTEWYDVDAATDLGIIVGYGATPENFLGVAEAVVMLIAALRKQLIQKHDAARGGAWRVPYAGHMVRGATVGLIGFGKIGQATALRLANWECDLICYDPYVSQDVATPFNVRMVDLDTLLRESDVVSIMVTLTDETRYMIGARELALMKPDAYIINTARGGLIDEAALFEALENNKLAGAALDTWENEAPDFQSPLRNHPKVLSTAHNVGHSEELYAGHPPAAAENTLRGLRGELPLYVRNPQVIPAWRERLKMLGVTAIEVRAQ